MRVWFKSPAFWSALLALALYAVCLGGTYIYDDVAIIQTDDRLTDPHQWGRYWTEAYNNGIDNLYRPLTSMSYAVEWQLHGDRPWIFHLINVLLHAAVCATLAEFVRRVTNTKTAFIVGLLFAAHPLHVEDVANIVGRAELLCTLATVGALLLITRPLTRARSLAITGCLILALLTKEQGMLLPFLLLLFVLLRRWRKPDFQIGDRQAVMLLVLACCWLLGGYIVLREQILHLKFWWDRGFLDWTIQPMVADKYNPHPGSIGADTWKMPLALLGRYFQLLVVPWKLSADYGGTVIGWHVEPGDPYFYLGFVACIGWLIAFAISFIKRSWLGLFACIGLGLSYGMVGNIVSLIGTNFAERLMYLPSVFFLIIVALPLARVPRNALITLMICLIGAAIYRTVTYAARWNDKLIFYRDSVADQPKSIRLRMLLGSEYAARKQWADADRAAREASELLPEYFQIWLQRGSFAMNQGHFDEAQQYFDVALKLKPSAKVQGWLNELDKERAAATQPTTAP